MDRAHLSNELEEHIRQQGLRSVGERVLRMVVNFHHYSIGACRDGRARHRQHLVSLAGAVRWVYDDWQMRTRLNRGHNREVERVASMVGGRSHSAFAEYDVVVAFGHDVLGCEKELFECGGHSALEHHRLSSLSHTPQQREILHVSSADLHHIGVLFDEVGCFSVQNFGDDPKTKSVADLVQYLETLLAKTLKRVGRRSRFKCASAKEDHSG